MRDALGNIRTITDGNGNITESRLYSPYGEPYGGTGSSQTVYGFTGEPKDDATGFVHLRARYYNPSLGQFMNLDPKETANRFAYVDGNPVNATDPTGLTFTLNLLLLAGIAIAAGLLSNPSTANALQPVVNAVNFIGNTITTAVTNAAQAAQDYPQALAQGYAQGYAKAWLEALAKAREEEERKEQDRRARVYAARLKQYNSLQNAGNPPTAKCEFYSQTQQLVYQADGSRIFQPGCCNITGKCKTDTATEDLGIIPPGYPDPVFASCPYQPENVALVWYSENKDGKSQSYTSYTQEDLNTAMESLNSWKGRSIWLGYQDQVPPGAKYGFDMPDDARLFGTISLNLNENTVVNQKVYNDYVEIWLYEGENEVYVLPSRSLTVEYARSDGQNYGYHLCGAYAVPTGYIESFKDTLEPFP